MAIELADRSPTDPRTMIRTARDFAVERPGFAVAAGMAGLHYMAHGYGYDIAGVDVLDGYSSVMKATAAAEIQEAKMKAKIRALISVSQRNSEFVRKILSHHLADEPVVPFPSDLNTQVLIQYD